MNLSIVIGFSLTPFSRRNILTHSRILDIVAPKAGRVGPEEAEKKNTENLFEFIQVRLPSLQISRSLSAHSLQRGRWCVNGEMELEEQRLPQYRPTDHTLTSCDIQTP